MKPMNIYLCIPFLLMALAAIASAQSDGNPASDPNWSSEVRQKISQGEIALGMTKDQARAALSNNSGVRRL
ncbi:MAG: hypothetical protein HUJ16_00060, partial [Kangiella sp.]|nr:hypothetical protein [Kangiella sp.]